MLTKNTPLEKGGGIDIDIVKVILVKDTGSPYRKNQTKNPESAAIVAKEFLAGEDREVFIVMNLDPSRKINSIHVVAIGSANATIVHPREVFKTAILSNASDIILAHNHPSGALLPSDEDCQITRMLVEAGNILGIKVLDHIIVGDDGHLSFAEMYAESIIPSGCWSAKNFKDERHQAKIQKRTISRHTKKAQHNKLPNNDHPDGTEKGTPIDKETTDQTKEVLLNTEEIIAYRVGDDFLCPKHYQMSVKILSVHEIDLPAQPVKKGEIENFVCRQCESLGKDERSA
jgi:DNA repair protein RadC